VAMSPVRNQPSEVNACAVESGRLRYPRNSTGPRSWSSPGDSPSERTAISSQRGTRVTQHVIAFRRSRVRCHRHHGHPGEQAGHHGHHRFHAGRGPDRHGFAARDAIGERCGGGQYRFPGSPLIPDPDCVRVIAERPGQRRQQHVLLRPHRGHRPVHTLCCLPVKAWTAEWKSSLP
jgi:hypothetical protein